MSDFLINFSKDTSGENLLDLIKLPYGELHMNGRVFDFPWGNIVVLEDHLSGNKNIIDRDGVVFAWVGDLVTQMSEEFITALINSMILFF